MTSELLALAAALVTLAVCLYARPIGEWAGVMAHPDGKRKTHIWSTPQVGGLAILSGLGVWLAGALLTPTLRGEPVLLPILLAGAGLGLVGFIDDKHEVPPVLRMLLLLVFMSVAFALDPQLISPTLNWHSFGVVNIPDWGYLPLMGLTCIGIVNSVNMADGQDGLVGSMFVVWSACLAILTTGTPALLAGMLSALSLIFLAFNLRGKLFLGDCGSYGVTFAIGLLVTLAHAKGQVSLETVIVWFFIPVMDCLRLMITRPMQGRRRFEGGRDHFHHRLIDSMGKRLSAFVYIAAVASSSLFVTLVPRFTLVCMCALCGFYFSFARFSEGAAAAPASESDEDDETNVVSMGSQRQ
ncbi:MAG TPA: MraY family glycosyltransferase [Rhizomicrobium sp.]|nr:MraY family glycosyltransferase [Rhizomicrobium sp.]